MVLSEGWFWTTSSVGCGSSFIRRRELYDFSSRNVFVFFGDFPVVTVRYFIANGISVTLDINVFVNKYNTKQFIYFQQTLIKTK